MNELISRADRTRTELLANRRRFQREGVTLVAGERADLYVLPIESARLITVRPAVRLCDDAATPLEAFFSIAFDRLGPAIVAVLLTILAALVAVQVLHATEHLRG